MKIFSTKVTYPAEESIKENKQTTTKRVEIATEVTQDQVLDLYRKLLEADYKVNISFKAPDKSEGADEEEADPFKLAENLTKSGIDYKANLKVSTKGAYSDMLTAIKLIENAGFDLNVTAQLVINEESGVNIDHPDSWIGPKEEAVYKITPKIKSHNALELKDVYEKLNDQGFEAQIDIKPKVAKDASVENAGDVFAQQLASYPDDTLVCFNLSQGA